MEKTEPRLFSERAVVVCNAFGLVLLLPVVFLGMIAASLFGFGLVTFLSCLPILAAAVFFLPFGFGNSYVTGLVRSLPAPGTPGQPRFIVQLTVSPRLREGLRAVLEDADDIGWLSFTESHLVYHGDAVRLSIPFEQIRRFERQRIGWRRFFFCNPRLELIISGLPGVESVQFAERSSWILPTSRQTARALHQHLTERIAASH